MKLGFKMKLNPGMAEEYRRRHDLLWPEMWEMIHQYGGRDYSIFLDEETLTLFACIDVEDPARWEESASSPVCRRWWDYMADIMAVNPDNSPQSQDLRLMFHLD